jgi:hypothetical protein
MEEWIVMRDMTKKNPKKIVNTSININGKENLIKLQNSVETNKMTLTSKQR